MGLYALLTLYGDSLTYTIAKALSWTGQSIVIYIADKTRYKHASKSSGITSRLAGIPNTEVVISSCKSDHRHFDRLIIQGHHLLLQDRMLLDSLSKDVSSITAITYGDRNLAFNKALVLQWQERLWIGEWLEKIDRVAYKDGFYRADLHGLFKRRTVIGFDPHSAFLHEPSLYDLLHAQEWRVLEHRPYRLNFIGSRDPERRQRILAKIEQQMSLFDDTTKGRIFWYTYTDKNPAGLEYTAFLRILEQSDFTLAPLGYSLVTHRPIEAMLKGSIPVIDERELDLYDLGLRDGINCIAVARDDWSSAVKRIMKMNEDQIMYMRQNIHAMLDSSLRYPVLARNICRRLGIAQY